MAILKDLIPFLRSGGRLEKPSLIPNPVAVLMAKCWMDDPMKRPNFIHLERELGNLLETTCKITIFKNG